MSEIDIFSSRLKALRESLGMTQKEFSDYIGVRQQTLSGYERVVMRPPLDTLKDIAEKCNVSVDWLLGLSDKKNCSEELLTYGDMLRLIIKLTNINIAFTNYWDIIYIPANDDFSNPNPEYAVLQISDSTVIDFFKEWEKMYKLYRDETIDMHLYTLWLEDKLKKYDKIRLLPNPPTSKQ